MLGPGTQSVYVPERYRDAKTFEKLLKEYCDSSEINYLLWHIAPSGSNIYFQSEPKVPEYILFEFQESLWDRANKRG